MQTITVDELGKPQGKGTPFGLVDVRVPTQYREVRAEGAENFPLDSLNPSTIEASRNGRSGQPL